MGAMESCRVNGGLLPRAAELLCPRASFSPLSLGYNPETMAWLRVKEIKRLIGHVLHVRLLMRVKKWGVFGRRLYRHLPL